ncbi:MAG: low temperature requirement protein A [Rhodoferax sp.]|nr:low temperature requirement protein A [Rhodoferax sp.]
MSPRDPHESHRASTPLELLFDLVTVIAIASAAAGLHHALAADHATEGVFKFVGAFFAIWWAWMNYTWLASAYDNDDALFRVLTMVVMGGSLTVAAGVDTFFATNSLLMLIIGYVVMRLAMVVLWLRAGRGDPARRKTTRIYAMGIALVQLYWIALIPLQPLPGGWLIVALLTGWVLELSVPAIAERKGATPWHRQHIVERYGLLTIIVLGETLLAAVAALTHAAGEHFDIRFVHIALSALVITLSMWWLYFSREEHLTQTKLSHALTWGYGHAPLFAAGAAVGAGFAVLVDVVGGHATISLLAGDYTVAIPAAIYLLTLWFVRDRFVLGGVRHGVLPVFAVLVLLAPLVFGLEAVSAVMALCVGTREYVSRLEG